MARSLASQTDQYEVDKLPRLVTTYLLRGTCLCNSQADAKDSIGAQIGLILGSIQLVQEFIDLRLVCDIESFLNDRRADNLIDICDGFEDPFPSPFGFVTIPELTCFMLSCSNVSSFLLSDLLFSVSFFPVLAPLGTMLLWRPVLSTRSTSTVGLPRLS